MGEIIKIIIFSLVLATLLYPGLEKLYLYRQTYILEDLVMAPLEFLGENQTILSNDDKFTRYGTNYKSLDLVRGSDLSIGIKNEFLPHERWVNLSKERERVYKERLGALSRYYKKLSKGEYSMVIYGPSKADISDIIPLSQKVEDKKVDIDNYCGVFLPSTEHKCTLCRYLIRVFINSQMCDSFVSKVIEYYKNNFYKICSYSELSANTIVKMGAVANGYFIADKCENGGKLLTNFNNKSLRFDDFLSLLYLSLIIMAFAFFKVRKIFLVLVLLVLLSLPFLTWFNLTYASDYYKNETGYAYSRFQTGLPKQLILTEKSFPRNKNEQAEVFKLEPKLNFTRYYDEI